MRRFLLVLLYTFVLVQSHHGRRISNRVDPKTFNGRRTMKINLSNSTAIPATLNISSYDVLNYTSSILSTRIIPAIYMVAIIIGLPTNSLVLAHFSRKTGSLTSAVLYLSLAVSNLLLLLSLTFRVHYHINGNNWVFGELTCKIITACFYGNIYCSIHAHMCISIMQYLAVVHPFLYRGLSKKSCVTWASLTIWVVFALAMAPELLTRQTYHVSQVGITCHDVLPYQEEAYKHLISYRLFLILLGFMLPFVIITFSYGSIIHNLGRSSCDWTHYVKASTLVFGIFLLCFTPSNTIHFMHYVRLYASQSDDFYIYFSMAVCLCCFHSCLDPFLTYIITKTKNSIVDFISLSSLSPRSSTVA